VSNDRRECCGCDIDMTERVRQACREQSNGPLLGPLTTLEDGAAAETETVDLECDNGHLCTYMCIASPSER
jgi:hypothetical protein